MVNWQGAAGALAGGTLGFISGNIPGAIVGGNWGYQMGSRRRYKLTHNSPNRIMPISRRSRSRGRRPLKRKRSKSVTFSSSRTRGGSKSRSRSRSVSRSSRMSSLASAANRSVAGTESLAGTFRRKGSRVQLEGRKRRVQGVTKKFKKKVRAAVKPTAPLGIFIESSTLRVNDPGAGQQSVSNLGFVAVGSAMCFDPISVLHAASVLWFNKTPVQVRGLVNTEISQFPVHNLKIFVEDQYTQFTYKNVTARVIVPLTCMMTG